MKKVDIAEVEEVEDMVKAVLAVTTKDKKVEDNLPRSMETNLVQFIKAGTINKRIAPRIQKALTSRKVININNKLEEENNTLLMEADLAVAVDTGAVEKIITNNTNTIIIINILINSNNNILWMIPLLIIRRRLATVVTVQEVLPYHHHLEQAIKAIVIWWNLGDGDCNFRHCNGSANNNNYSNLYPSLEARDFLGDAAVLPNQVIREVDGSLFTNSSHISSSTPLVESVKEDDDINCEQL